MENKDIRKANLEHMLEKHLATSGNTKAGFAELLGISSSQFSQLIGEKSVRNVGDKMARKIETSLGLPNGWLDSIHTTESIDANVASPQPFTRGASYPLISWVSAGAWCEAIEPYTLSEILERYESNAHVEGDAFWLRVKGDSMTSPYGQSIAEGMMILVDTGREPKNGSLVVAKLTDANEATFKKLVIDSGLGKKYLQPLNPQQERIEVNGNCKIIGVAIEQRGSLI